MKDGSRYTVNMILQSFHLERLEGQSKTPVPSLRFEPNTSQIRSSCYITLLHLSVIWIFLDTLGGGQSFKLLNESLIWDQQLVS